MECKEAKLQEEVKMAGSRNAKGRTSPFKGVKFPWVIRNSLSIFSRIGAGASVYKESASDASLQTPCKTAHCVKTVPNAFFIKLFIDFFFIFKHKHV